MLSPELQGAIGGLTIAGLGWFGKFLVERFFKKADESETASLRRIEASIARLEGKVDGMAENVARIAASVAVNEREAKAAHARLDEHRDMFKEIRSELRQ